MNVFRILGDVSHLLAIIILLLKILKSKSCAGECSHALGKEGGGLLLEGGLARGARKTGTGKAGKSPHKLAALSSGLFKGRHPLPPGGLPARTRGLRWKDVMWQGARPRAGDGLGAVKRRRRQQGQRESENERKKLWQHQKLAIRKESSFRSEVLPAGGQVPEAAPSLGEETRAAAAHRRTLFRIHGFLPKSLRGWAAAPWPLSQVEKQGGSDCMSLPAMTKLHQRPWAGP